MRFGQAVSLVECVHKSQSVKQTIFLLGPPGIGKSSVAKEVARRNADEQIDVVIVDLSNCLPEDLNGLPKTDGDVMKFIPDEWLHKLCSPEANAILVLDDLAAASSSIQVATRQLALDRRIHNHVLGPKVTIIVTGNRATDRAKASMLPSHFRNSVLQIVMEPDFDSWSAWYRAQAPRVNLLVLAFLVFAPKHFSTLPSDADELGSFATPRTWAMLGQLLPIIMPLQDETILHETVVGLVGTGVGSEFLSFLRLQKDIIPPADILRDPQAAIPNPEQVERSLLVAFCYSIVSAVVTHGAEGGFYNLSNLVAALLHLTQNKRDIFSFSFFLVESLGGLELRRDFARVVAKMAKMNPGTMSVVRQLSDVMNS